eukprot:COSAG06_NODE_29616_length_553_cov_0.865639_1_plen_149_part_01
MFAAARGDVPCISICFSRVHSCIGIPYDLNTTWSVQDGTRKELYWDSLLLTGDLIWTIVRMRQLGKTRAIDQNPARVAMTWRSHFLRNHPRTAYYHSTVYGYPRMAADDFSREVDKDWSPTPFFRHFRIAFLMKSLSDNLPTAGILARS